MLTSFRACSAEIDSISPSARMVLSPEASLSSGSNKESGKSMEKRDGRNFYHQAGEGSSRNFDMDPNSENPWSTPSEMWEQEEALMSSQTQMQLNFLNQKDLRLEGLSHPYYPKEGSLGGIGHSYEEIVPVNQTLHDIIIPMAGVQSLHNGLPGDSLGDAMSKESCEREIKQEMRAESSDGSDPMDEDEDKGGGSRSGRRHLSKNLVAERKRRKKLNERLYALRALVPKITKMDRASILGDAIEYVRELQSRVDNLHKELLEDEDILDVETILEDGIKDGCLEDIKSSDPRLDTILEDQRVEIFVQPLEVSVHKLEDNCFCVRILSEKSEGIFLSVLRVMDDFGFDILHANLITFRGIALNVFNAEVKDQKVPLVEEVKESLLQICKAREIADDSMHLMNSNLSQVLDG